MPIYFERVMWPCIFNINAHDPRKKQHYNWCKKLQLFWFIEQIHKVFLATVFVLAFYMFFIMIRYFDHYIVVIGVVREEISISQQRRRSVLHSDWRSGFGRAVWCFWSDAKKTAACSKGNYNKYSIYSLYNVYYLSSLMASRPLCFNIKLFRFSTFFLFTWYCVYIFIYLEFIHDIVFTTTPFAQE